MHWTLRSPADKAVELGYVDSVAREAARQSSKKNELKPRNNKAWWIPGLSGEFVVRMEDMLELYGEEYDAERAAAFFDETSKQLAGLTRAHIDAKIGRLQRYGYEYRRNRTHNLFVFCEPKGVP